MSDKEKIAMAVGAVVFVFCYIKVFLFGKSREQRFVERAKKKGCFTQGKVIDTKIIQGNEDSKSSYFRNDRLKVTYEYFVNGKSYKKKLVFQSKGMVSTEYPYSTTIYYNPFFPSRGVSDEETSQEIQRERGCFLTLLYTSLTLFILLNFEKIIKFLFG